MQCDGARPLCGPCLVHGTPCVYAAQAGETSRAALKREHDTLNEKYEDLLSLFSLLRSASDPVATEILQRLRRGSSPKTLLQTATGQDLRRSPSLHETLRGVLPVSFSSLEFELISLHPKAYPSLPPLEVSRVDLKLLGLPLAGKIKPASAQRNRSRVRAATTTSEYTSGSSAKSDHATKVTIQLSVRPSQVAIDPSIVAVPKYADERLDNLDISIWTNLAVTHHLVAEAISMYLRNDHPILGFFNADLFLDDLVKGETAYCSRLLFHALLSWAFVRHWT